MRKEEVKFFLSSDDIILHIEKLPRGEGGQWEGSVSRGMSLIPATCGGKKEPSPWRCPLS